MQLLYGYTDVSAGSPEGRQLCTHSEPPPPARAGHLTCTSQNSNQSHSSCCRAGWGSVHASFGWRAWATGGGWGVGKGGVAAARGGGGGGGTGRTRRCATGVLLPCISRSHLLAELIALLRLHHPGQRSQGLGALLLQRHSGGQRRRRLAPRGYDITRNQYTSRDGLGEETDSKGRQGEESLAPATPRGVHVSSQCLNTQSGVREMSENLLGREPFTAA